MWKIIQSWKRVSEVFIARKLNGRGQIFDFVRFKEVVNEVELEKRLGEVSIGNMKSHRPKYKSFENHTNN